MTQLDVGLMGTPIFLTEEGQSVDLGRKATALFAYLAAQPGRRASRVALAQLLWGDARSTRASRHALRQCLVRLRRAVGLARVGSDAHWVWLNLDGTRIDIHELEAADGSKDPDRVVAAAALCRGPFCASLDIDTAEFEDWLRERRVALGRVAAKVNGAAAELLATRGEDAAAVAAARRRVALEPYDEAAHAALIALSMKFRRRQEAHAAHAACRSLFARDLGVAPGREIDDALGTPPLPARAGHRSAGPAQRPRAPIRGAELAALVTLCVTLMTGLLGRGLPPSDRPMTAARLWVMPDEATATPHAHSDGPTTSPALETGGEGHGSAKNAIYRALRGDPAFSQLYPTGC